MDRIVFVLVVLLMIYVINRLAMIIHATFVARRTDYYMDTKQERTLVCPESSMISGAP